MICTRAAHPSSPLSPPIFLSLSLSSCLIDRKVCTGCAAGNTNATARLFGVQVIFVSNITVSRNHARISSVCTLGDTEWPTSGGLFLEHMLYRGSTATPVGSLEKSSASCPGFWSVLSHVDSMATTCAGSSKLYLSYKSYLNDLY